jgi:hypothetical protein
LSSFTQELRILQVGLGLLLIVGSLVWLEQLMVSWSGGCNIYHSSKFI